MSFYTFPAIHLSPFQLPFGLLKVGKDGWKGGKEGRRRGRRRSRWVLTIFDRWLRRVVDFHSVGSLEFLRVRRTSLRLIVAVLSICK